MRIELGLCSSALVLVLMATAALAEFRLSGSQIDAHVSGNTLKITTKNLQEARGYFTPDGTVKGRDGNRDFVGKWRAHDDMLCLDIPQFDDELCRTVVVRGDLLFLFTQTGVQGKPRPLLIAALFSSSTVALVDIDPLDLATGQRLGFLDHVLQGVVVV